jgi:hypothetical protein
VVGEHADGFELVVVEQVGFVDDQDGGAAAFGGFGGEGVGGLGDEGGAVGAGVPPRAVTMAWWMPRVPTVGLGSYAGDLVKPWRRSPGLWPEKGDAARVTCR